LDTTPQLKPSQQKKTQPRTGANPGIDAAPITEIEEARYSPTKGRPKKRPPMPYMPMEEAEKLFFDGFIEEYLTEYPDMTPTDYRLLFLAAIEYIKYLRIAAKELESHQVISMARQHPAVNMRALLDQLNATRKLRSRGKTPETDEAAEFRDYLLKLSKPGN
jgi:hypothetical protein